MKYYYRYKLCVSFVLGEKFGYLGSRRKSKLIAFVKKLKTIRLFGITVFTWYEIVGSYDRYCGDDAINIPLYGKSNMELPCDGLDQIERLLKSFQFDDSDFVVSYSY